MLTKFVMNISLTVAHQDGTRVTKKAIAQEVKSILRDVIGHAKSSGTFHVERVAVRSVDTD